MSGPPGLPGPERFMNVTRGPSGRPGSTGQPGYHGPAGDGVNFYIFKKKKKKKFSFYTLYHLNNKVH